jgi:hypothetical protein
MRYSSKVSALIAAPPEGSAEFERTCAFGPFAWVRDMMGRGIFCMQRPDGADEARL